MATRKPKSRRVYLNARVGVLFLDIDGEEYGYWLDPISHDMGEGTRCYRLSKFKATCKPGEPEAYDVVVNPASGTGSCECKGHLRWGHRTICKHIACLLALHAEGRLS